MQSQKHFHIRWSDSSLDWKAFPTKEEATRLAALLKKPDQHYSIEEFDDECERCKVLLSQAQARYRSIAGEKLRHR
jgi:hypothetical protein